jgi:hypothetical protein
MILPAVVSIRARIPGWQRSLAAAAAEANHQPPDISKLQQLLSSTATGPARSADELQDTAAAAQSTPQQSLGTHADLLHQRLLEAAEWWNRSLDAANKSDASGALSSAQQAQASLDAAMKHVLFITFINDVRNGHVGESRGIDAYCAGWGLASSEVKMLWAWLKEDPLDFDGHELPVVLDTVNRCGYRRTDNPWFRFFTAMTSVWGAAVVFGLTALLFALLHAARLTSWPSACGWKLLVLLLFVALGALAHVGANSLDINYNDPMKVYDAGNLIDWLSLRWLAIIRLYVPVAVVLASLWGAGNIPTSFRALGTAVLAGYTADSFVRSALSRLQADAAKM